MDRTREPYEDTELEAALECEQMKMLRAVVAMDQCLTYVEPERDASNDLTGWVNVELAFWPMLALDELESYLERLLTDVRQVRERFNNPKEVLDGNATDKVT